METAELVQENLVNYRNQTNLYHCSDGRYLLVSVPKESSQFFPPLEGLGFGTIVVENETVDIFLSNEEGQVVDFDDNPVNGMTALASFSSKFIENFKDALAIIGYTLIEEEV